MKSTRKFPESKSNFSSTVASGGYVKVYLSADEQPHLDIKGDDDMTKNKGS
jgi:hypothetical protein